MYGKSLWAIVGNDTCETVMLMTSVKKRNDSLNQDRAVPKEVLHKKGSIILIRCGIDS